MRSLEPLKTRVIEYNGYQIAITEYAATHSESSYFQIQDLETQIVVGPSCKAMKKLLDTLERLREDRLTGNEVTYGQYYADLVAGFVVEADNHNGD